MEGGEEGGGVAGEGKEAEEWKDRGDPWYPDSGLCREGLLLAANCSTYDHMKDTLFFKNN